jgi:hypothetical protein
MYTATIHRLGFNYDRTRQALVFTGMLENGFQFEVCFPIGHVALTFDNEHANLGYIGEPMMGDVATIEGFFSSLVKVVTAPARAVQSAAKSVASTAKKAYDNTIKKVAQQAVYYAKKGVTAVGKGIAAGAKFVATAALVPFKAAYDIGSGKNVLQSLQGVIKQVQMVASFVPGVGTLASVGLGGMNGVLQGKSLTEVAKGVFAGAIPGGPLVTAAAMTAANMVQAGVEGKNIIKAAATELAKEALKFVPSADAQAILLSATNAALSGQNVLQGAKAAIINQALAQISDPGAQQALRATLAGKPVDQIVAAAGGKFLLAVAAIPNSKTGALVGGIVHQVTAAAPAVRSGPSGIAAPPRYGALAANQRAAATLTSAMQARQVAPVRGAVSALANAMWPRIADVEIGAIEIGGVEIGVVEISGPFGYRPSHAFAAIGANALAAVHASTQAVPRLRQMRGQIARLAQSNAPHHRMAIAGLKSVRI